MNFNNVIKQLMLEYRLVNKYDVVTGKSLKKFLNLLLTNSYSKAETFMFSIDDSINKFRIKDVENKHLINVFLKISQDESSGNGYCTCNKETSLDKKLYLFLSKKHIDMLKDKRNYGNNEIVETINNIYETIKHELEHLSDFSVTKRRSTKNNLNREFKKTFNVDDVDKWTDVDGFVERFKNYIHISQEYFDAKNKLDLLDDDFLVDMFEEKVKTVETYTLLTKEVAAKLAGLKIKITRTNERFEDVLIKYLTNIIAYDKNYQKYNEIKNIKEVNIFFKKAILFMLNCFIYASFIKFPQIDKKFNKVQILDSTYNYNKDKRIFE